MKNVALQKVGNLVLLPYRVHCFSIINSNSAFHTGDLVQ